MADSKPVKINLAWCKGCGLCLHVCPSSVFKWSERIGDKGFHVPVVAEPRKCIRCMQCEITCPDMAITVVERRKKAKGKKPAAKPARKKIALAKGKAAKKPAKKKSPKKTAKKKPRKAGKKR